MCRGENGYKKSKETMRITVLVLKTSARCCRPCWPIELLERSSMVSVCEKERMNE